LATVVPEYQLRPSTRHRVPQAVLPTNSDLQQRYTEQRQFFGRNQGCQGLATTLEGRVWLCPTVVSQVGGWTAPEVEEELLVTARDAESLP